MDSNDTSRLTEFPRFEPESTQSGVTNFFSKLFRPLFYSGETSENKNGDGKPRKQIVEVGQEQHGDDGKLETATYAEELEGRSLPNVLRRISSLMALGSGSGTRYADTELARYWMPDDISRECYECATRFSTLRRRHHCRVCGQIFCSRCCSQRVPGHIFGCAGGLRVCTYCCNVVLSYLRENDMSGDMSPDLKSLQENLQTKFPDNKHLPQSTSRDNFMFGRDHDERHEDRQERHRGTKETLHEVFRQLCLHLPTQQHRYRLVRYNGVWQGCDILHWLIENTEHKTRAQASLVCQSLLSAGLMESSIELQHFADYGLYRPAPLPPLTPQIDTPEDCANRLVESVSSYCLDLDLDESSARLIKASKTDNKLSPSSEEDNPMLEHTDGNADTKTVCKAISESGDEHLKLLMRQCLARQALPATWLDVLYPLCQQAADSVQLDLYTNDIDVRNYVQVKKLPCGYTKDSCVIQGVVMTKNVAHRGMPQQLSNPTVLVLDCSIAYQRVEGKLTSLEPVLLQEQEYLIRCAARISALRPKVVLVKGSAARAVQDVLRNDGVALAVGVREKALQRAARCAKADIVTSIDARIGLPRLGTCKSFYVKNYANKTLMVLENGAETQLGCCILLQGASLQELVRVKKVAKFMVLACYNWKLEKTFLCDIDAVLPEPGMTFDDENDIEKSKNDRDSQKLENKNTDVSNSNEALDVESNEKLAKVNELAETNESDEAKVNELAKENELRKSRDLANASPAKMSDSNQDDPLRKSKGYVRKTDSDKNLSCGVPIRDFSDPLRARQMSMDDDVFLPKNETVLKADSHTDRWSTDDVVLSMSPNVVISAPFVATSAGRKCRLSKYFPVLPFGALARTTSNVTQGKGARSVSTGVNVTVKESHPFITNPITCNAEDPSLKASLAHFRATGCRLVNNNHYPNCPSYLEPITKALPTKELENKDPKVEKLEQKNVDPFDPEHHQQINLLLFCYSTKSSNMPDFCVNPWTLTMDMYGRRDITLGAFLEKYCFNADTKCSSSSCHVPINQHVRKFVHGDVCITITCNTVGHSNVDKIDDTQKKQVMFWSRCNSCATSGRASRISRLALQLSLATYLSLRVRAARYLRESHCNHPTQKHAHFFASGTTTASFKYNKISTWEIEFPPDVIATLYDTRQMRDALINQVNDLMLKGHETFSAISESDAERDHQAFKTHMEQIHLALASVSLQESTPAGVVRALWNISDRIIYGEKMRRDAHDKWSIPPAKPNTKHNDNTVEDKPDSNEDATSIDSGNIDNIEAAIKDEPDKVGVEEDEEKGDKKTVRQILTQLLSNNTQANQSGMIITGGLFPICVAAGEVGSVIAATLASVVCRAFYSNQTHLPHEEIDSNNAGKEKTDAEKTKAKSNEHIEVLLKEGLICRVYYAQQFHRLRHMLLAPLAANDHITDSFAKVTDSNDEYKDICDNKNLCDIEEGFIRSLAHCVPWAAKGGKSGSTFCKTKDDRYVLKEMTKPEWQQFLEFAPHYFNYVISCRQNNRPSLLARIVGVYGVGGAGNGVLVMENVFYARPSLSARFDLKGSSRHRLARDTQPQAVLMDENLLKMRIHEPLYLQSDTAGVLFGAVERDTEFLASHDVMDYSLLLGIDGSTLVLGIIDYIRTFTWDKRLEHLVKKNLGSGQPTVVSPEQYRARFSAALRKYCLRAAAHWDPIVYDRQPVGS